MHYDCKWQFCNFFTMEKYFFVKSIKNSSSITKSNASTTSSEREKIELTKKRLFFDIEVYFFPEQEGVIDGFANRKKRLQQYIVVPREKKRKYFRKTFFLPLEIGKNSFAKEDEVVVKTWKIYLDFGWSPNGCQKLCRCGTWHRSGNVVGMVVRELRGIFEQILLGLLECFYVLLCKHMYSRMYITYALVQIREQA